MIGYPRWNANDTEQICMVLATPQELYEVGYFLTVSAASAEVIWRR